MPKTQLKNLIVPFTPIIMADNVNLLDAYISKVSFQTGLRHSLIVLVFLFWESPWSGISFAFTYGSLWPLGSIGIRLRASRTGWVYLILKVINHYLPRMDNMLTWQVMLMRILPLLSVWSHPHRFGTVSMHFLCTFMSQAANILVSYLWTCAGEFVFNYLRAMTWQTW